MKNFILKSYQYFGMLFLFISLTSGINAQTWMQENPQSSSNFNNVFFVDNNTGWAIADSMNGALFVGSILKKTTNKGATWSNQSIGSNFYQLKACHFFNASKGIIVAKYLVTNKGSILTTINGGNTWTTNDTFPKALNDVFFINSTIGWVCGKNGYIAKSTDGGTSWTAQVSNAPDHLFSIHFADINNGWAVGPNGVIVHTTDGGTNWVLQTSPVPGQDNFSVFALNSSTAFAVGSSGLMIKTSNNGAVWDTVSVPTIEHIFDITFANSSDGWAVGAAGNIEITTNAGLTWASQTSNTTNDINAIAMFNNTTGWYVGNAGDVYYYALNPLSVNEINKNINVSVYPNPFTTQTKINIESSLNISNYNLSIYNLLGKKVFDKTINNVNQFILNRNNLKAGIYILNITANNQIIKTEKLIIQ